MHHPPPPYQAVAHAARDELGAAADEYEKVFADACGREQAHVQGLVDLLEQHENCRPIAHGAGAGGAAHPLMIKARRVYNGATDQSYLVPDAVDGCFVDVVVSAESQLPRAGRGLSRAPAAAVKVRAFVERTTQGEAGARYTAGFDEEMVVAQTAIYGGRAPISQPCTAPADTAADVLLHVWEAAHQTKPDFDKLLEGVRELCCYLPWHGGRRCSWGSDGAPHSRADRQCMHACQRAWARC